MSDIFRGLEKASIIRIILFVCLIGWAMFCFLAYMKDLNNGSDLTNNYVNTSDIDNVNIDGSDFTLAFRLMGAAANGLITFVYCIVILLLVVIETIFVFIPVMLLRFIGLRKKYIDTVNEDEYKITKYIYLFAIGLSVILGLIVANFAAIIPMILLDAAWILLLLIYVLGLKNTLKTKELINNQGEKL